MAFDLEVVFTGLSLVCVAGAPPCGSESMVYLVNATHEQQVCGMRMEGHHRPLLAFDSRLMLPGSTSAYTLEPAPDGDQNIVADLQGRELCIRIAPRKGRTQDLPGMASPPERRTGRAPGQDHPRWWKPEDHLAFDWIPFLESVDSSTQGKPYCLEVTADLAQNSYVVSRVKLQGGTLSSRSCHHLNQGVWRRMFAMDYVVWESTGAQSGQGNDFPKALPDEIVWRVENLPEDHIVVLQDCAKKPVQTLFRLDSRGKAVELHVSNLPETNVQSTAGPHLEHFRWYYRLLDWNGGGCSGDECPPNVALPKLPTSTRFGDDAMRGLLSNSVHCPPGGSGSP